MQIGHHVQSETGRTGVVHDVLDAKRVSVQWDDRPLGDHYVVLEEALVHDFPADARALAITEEHRQMYNEARATGRYQGD